MRSICRRSIPNRRQKRAAEGLAQGSRSKYDNVLYISVRFTAASAPTGSVVPFYLDDTIGGSDINGIPTLRGFQDYRFRGPDLGQVALQASDLSFGNLRQSYGFGLTFWSGNKVWFRAYVGLGSGEGSHSFFGVNDRSPQTPHL
jgi:hypothetical protein